MPWECELQRAKEREFLRYRCVVYLAVGYPRMNLGHEVADKENATTSNLLSILTAAIDKQSNLLNVFWNRDPWKEPGNVPAAGLKLLLVPDLALDPAIGIKRRL